MNKEEQIREFAQAFAALFPPGANPQIDDGSVSVGDEIAAARFTFDLSEVEWELAWETGHHAEGFIELANPELLSRIQELLRIVGFDHKLDFGDES